MRPNPQAQAAFVGTVPDLVRGMVKGVAATLAAVADNVESLPPQLDLGDGTEPPTQRAEAVEEDGKDAEGKGKAEAAAAAAAAKKAAAAQMQFRDLMSWEVESNSPDPGQVSRGWFLCCVFLYQARTSCKLRREPTYLEINSSSKH